MLCLLFLQLTDFLTKIEKKNAVKACFYFNGLLKYLEEKSFPKIVWIFKNGTKITGKVEFDSSSNQILTFV